MTRFETSPASEYLPQESERQNGNGQSSQPYRQKNFEIKPSTDPDTLKILEARDKALGDPSLSRPVRAFVCFIVDRCLNPRFFDEKGVVCMADSIAAEKFGVTVRTIYDWRHWPGIERYLWFSKKGRPNMWPMMVYHLACLHPAPREEKRTDAGGTYAGGASDRFAPGEDLAAAGRERRNAALAAKRAQKNLPLQGGMAVVPEAKVPVATPQTGSRPAFRLPKSATFRAISAEARENVRLWAEENFGSEPKKISAQSRRKLRLPAEENFGSEPKKTSAAGRSSPPPPAEADCRHLETQNEKEVGTETLLKRSTGLNAQNAGRGRKASRENTFLLDVAAMMERWKAGSAKGELSSSGAWWRLKFRKSPELLERVLAETLRAVKESQIKTTPGQYAVDLFKRWLEAR